MEVCRHQDNDNYLNSLPAVAESHTLSEPFDEPVQRSPQGATAIAETLPWLCAFQAATFLVIF